MSADWKSGDRALCVDDSEGTTALYEYPSGYVIRNTVYLVELVTLAPDKRSDSGQIAIFICGLPVICKETGEQEPWQQCRFRKIVPACDRVSVEQEQEAAP